MKSFKEFLEEVKGGGVNRKGLYKIGTKLTLKTKKSKKGGFQSRTGVIVKALSGKDEGKYVVKTETGDKITLSWTEFDINESTD